MAPRQDATAARGGQAAAGAGGRLDLPRAARGLRPKLRPQEPRTPPRPSSRARRARRGAPAGVARVQLVRRDGRDVSTLYGGEGGGGAARRASLLPEPSASSIESPSGAADTCPAPRAPRHTPRRASRRRARLAHPKTAFFSRKKKQKHTPRLLLLSRLYKTLAHARGPLPGVARQGDLALLPLRARGVRGRGRWGMVKLQ